MNKLSVSDWIQITTGLTVLAGVALVVWELNQTRNLVFTTGGFRKAGIVD
jgi:hypothetical protein